MGHAWTTYLGFILLTANSAAAVYRSHGDVSSISFVGGSYVSLLLLFLCLRWFETASNDGLVAARGRAKAGVWILTTLLTAMFSWRVASLMPSAVAGAVWLVAASTVFGGFYALFLLPSHRIE